MKRYIERQVGGTTHRTDRPDNLALERAEILHVHCRQTRQKRSAAVGHDQLRRDAVETGQRRTEFRIQFGKSEFGGEFFAEVFQRHSADLQLLDAEPAADTVVCVDAEYGIGI